MVISNIDLSGTSARPAEHDSPLIVDPDAVKALEVSPQSLQPVSGRGGKITQLLRIIQHIELPDSYFRDTGPPYPLVDSTLPEEPFDVPTGETLYRHGVIIPQLGIPSKGKVGLTRWRHLQVDFVTATPEIRTPPPVQHPAAGGEVAVGKVSSWFEFFATASPRQVYILRSLIDPDRHYVGLTADVHQRLAWHNVGQSAHMPKEEQILFQMIQQAQGSMAEGPNSVMEGEHEDTATALRRLRSLTDDYTLPEEACQHLASAVASPRGARSLHRHIHLENNIFSPVRSQVSTELALRIEERERTRRSRGMPVAAALDLSSEAWASIRQRPLPS